MKPRVVLYNPRAVFYTMPLSLLALASALDRDKVDVVIIDGRLESDPVRAVVSTRACHERRTVRAFAIRTRCRDTTVACSAFAT